MTTLDLCWARLHECRSLEAVDNVIQDAYRRVMLEHGHSMTAAEQNTEIGMLRERRLEQMKRKAKT